ncbi:glycosyl transferase family 1 (plasmid) [Azospirillum baldaniorum]|uniref:Glycosyltransferase, group 1 n=1 Tax=Azospirillum baldaniorum TaxID=1064539 RepID=A0A9P1K1T8_9PROT|nr:glycosyltransferase family 4 protein [Azospirillum baldaniorum]AWJ93478.1 glycosyl transferase family 1 [Azospirillum baldaniorum]NUB05060.1 glycosyltransferase [Azospirillum baldaniorum]TWA71709.1 glycosyltransferase involved in cell wall biosynthesis [Azospirillum brasilense]CCD03965.1 putative glycosyltransferase, group 1 [Azospirillum baldaniorum]
MNYLFVHQNFPGQYQHIVQHLAAQPGNRVVFISHESPASIPGVERAVYQPFRTAKSTTHHYIQELELAVVYGQSVYEVCRRLKAEGFRPDIMIGHNGWGETLYMKDVWPDVPLLAYFEFFYHLRGADIGFDPMMAVTENDGPRVRTKNVINTLGFEAADWGQTPTGWQWSLYPDYMRSRISVIHEGVDTTIVRPDADAWLRLPSGLTLTPKDEVITYVARNLEPYRGFHVFMRALPGILKRRPRAHVLIVGGDEVSYGQVSPDGRSYRDILMAEIGSGIDRNRVHFLGKLPYGTYLSVLRVSSAHIYLTYPFVLSWSFLEAMAAGCLVIGSATIPVEEVLRDRQNGLLVDFFDGTALADRIDEVFEHPDRMQTLRDRARRTAVENYDLRTVTLPRHLALIDDLIAGRNPAERMPK